MSEITAVSLFTEAGGMDIGFESAGMVCDTATPSVRWQFAETRVNSFP